MTASPRPIRRLLIANRGEIAVRVIRACADLGITSIAVHSDPDAEAMFVRLADEAYPLPGTAPSETYLDIAAIIQIARRAEADAIHPGYGFLSENADFAEAVIDAGLTWIGPPPQAIRDLGDKVTARHLALEVGAPLVPGTDGPAGSAEEVLAFADEHGLPIAIKAAFGGGGRGMKIVRDRAEIPEAFDSAVREATTAFGRGECFVERFLERPRHVEAQVLADRHGRVVVVGTRDCSLQRRNQKLVEEAPAPFLTDEQRDRIRTSATAICARAGYEGAGTVEYLVAPDGLISFLEVNTRLQVEHPVTEMTSGIDLVHQQIRIAEGAELDLPEEPETTGHAFEFRINAEDPALGFVPTPGPIAVFEPPTGAGVRVDTGVRSGDAVPAAYDSLMAKLIVHGADRQEAVRRARLALEEFRIDGIPSVLPFHRAVIHQDAFTAADRLGVHTTWIESEFAADLAASPYLAADAPSARTELTITLDGRSMRLGLPEALHRALLTGGGGAAVPIEAAEAEQEGAVRAPTGGALVTWLVEDGTVVEEGQGLVVLEAMKMETRVAAPSAGTFARADLEAGASVARGDVLGHVRAEG